MVKTMFAATQQMFENKRPDRTLKETFDQHFYPALGLTESEMQGELNQFYKETFPTLKKFTQQRPEAVTLIRESVKRGYQIGIATNPLFPRTAIVQRLAWAGLPEDEYPFVLIPSYETFHFAKPNPAFFAEFLARLGWPDSSAIMIGNDPDHDIRGAHNFGLSSFWISEGDGNLPEGYPEPVEYGTLTDILPWLDTLDKERLKLDFSSASAMIAILRGSPAAVNGLLAEIPQSLWTQRPHPKEWSLTEITCHLRDVEKEVNLPRLQKVLQENNPFISGVDSDIWAEKRVYIEQDGEQALKSFMAARIELLEILDGLADDAWKKPFRHTIFGPTDLREMIRIIAGHDQLHTRQILEILKK
jgi:FMN phosphatase YigB (HAD superfamily)